MQPTDPSINLPSERVFGLFFAVVFALITVWLWRKNYYVFTAASATTSILLLSSAIFFPGLLCGLNKAWFRLGMLLNAVVSPIVMGAIFFLIITPIALVMRLSGRDPLKRGYEPDAVSYWIDRAPLGPAPETFKNQF